ncbi:MAG: D-2-hydroxyacid dehydrogenase [Alicyclobacillus sp.]|nr:D-2-hydroxyacid dehydrogenase [Alicyclobacillus sp.]
MVYQRSHPEKFAAALAELGVTHTVCGSEQSGWDDREVSDVEVVFGWNVPPALLRQMPRLRWVQWSGAGVDAVVLGGGLPAGVRLTRIVGQFSQPIAEYIFSYLLYVVKDLERMRAAQQRHVWEPFRAGRLAGLTIGVAGLGSIGREVVRKARAFDMHVLGLSASGAHADCVDRHYGPSEWDAFAAAVDVLVLCLPLTDATRHVVDARLLQRMKPDAILVNIGRGALIREPDLLNHLAHGGLRAAVLDVFEQEPLPADHPFWGLSNVYVTPHLSGPSEVEATCQFFVDNLVRYLSGQPLLGEVDLARQY